MATIPSIQHSALMLFQYGIYALGSIAGVCIIGLAVWAKVKLLQGILGNVRKAQKQ